MQRDAEALVDSAARLSLPARAGQGLGRALLSINLHALGVERVETLVALGSSACCASSSSPACGPPSGCRSSSGSSSTVTLDNAIGRRHWARSLTIFDWVAGVTEGILSAT